MGEVLKFVRDDRKKSRLPSDSGNTAVVFLVVWELELVRRILSSISLFFWYWRGHSLIMDFHFDQSIAMYLKNPGSDKQIWDKIHSVFFRHYCQNMSPKRQVPFVIRGFDKSEINGGNIVRAYFEVEAWAGKALDGKAVEEEFYGNLTDENTDMFKCQFMIKTEERR